MSGQKKLVKEQNKYPDELKRKIAQEYLSGKFSYAVAAELYGLAGRAVVREFVRWYGKRDYLEGESLAEMKKKSQAQKPKDQPDAERQVEDLERQLAQAELKIAALETMIDLAEEQFRIAIRKKAGTKQSKE